MGIANPEKNTQKMLKLANKTGLFSFLNTVISRSIVMYEMALTTIIDSIYYVEMRYVLI